jgi:hypothetical protein
LGAVQIFADQGSPVRALQELFSKQLGNKDEMSCLDLFCSYYWCKVCVKFKKARTGSVFLNFCSQVMQWLQLICALFVVPNVKSFAAAFTTSAGASLAASTRLPLQKIVIIGDARVTASAGSKADFYNILKVHNLNICFSYLGSMKT